MSKLVRLTLALTLLIAGLTATAPRPQVALASTEDCPVAVQPAGAGEPDDPYRIATPGHLMWLSAESGEWGKEFIQVADIDFLTGTLAVCDEKKGWSPIGTSSNAFTGVYDGQGHSIKNLFINRPTEVEVGFFGRTVGAEIRHLHLIDVDITGRNEVGALIGTNRTGSTTIVYDVSVTVSDSDTGAASCSEDMPCVRSTNAGSADTGGLFGYTYDINIIFARADVNVNAAGRNVGGLVGDGTRGTSISRSRATGNVTSTSNDGQVGGLAGFFRGIEIIDSYAKGDVTAKRRAGELVGLIEDRESMVGLNHRLNAEIKRSFATGSITDCNSDCGFLIGLDVIGRKSDEDGLPAASTEMDIRTAAGGWDRVAVWNLPDVSGLPTLRTPPNRPVVTDLSRDGDDVIVTIDSVVTNGLGVTAYEFRTTGGFATSDPGNPLANPFGVPLDPTPALLRIRARSGDEVGPAVSFPAAPVITPVAIKGGIKVTSEKFENVPKADLVVQYSLALDDSLAPDDEGRTWRDATFTKTTAESDISLTGLVARLPHLVRVAIKSGAIVGQFSSPSGPIIPELAFEPIEDRFKPRATPFAETDRVYLGPLASRTQRGPLTVIGSGPRTVIGTDSRTGQQYTYTTDSNYSSAPQRREGDEVTADSPRVSTSSASGLRASDFSNDNLRTGSERAFTIREVNVTGVSGISNRSNVLELFQRVWCNTSSSGTDLTATNTFSGLQTYCTVFGPEIYSQPFFARSGEALGFEFAASGAGDDYEVYAFLVKVGEVDDLASGSAPGFGKLPGGADDEEAHLLVTYGRGKTLDWTTAAGVIPSAAEGFGDGIYRFRFVNGSFDATGGGLVGNIFYLDPDGFLVGEPQFISFDPLPDRIRTGADVTFELDPLPTTNAPGGSVDLSLLASPSSVCTLSGSVVTLKAIGTCTITASAAATTVDGTLYVAPQPVPRSFEVRASAVAPSNVIPPSLSGTAASGSTLTLDIGTWSDGGAEITQTTFAWLATVDGVTEVIPGATGQTFCIPPEFAGARIRGRVTRSNSIGPSEPATSAQSAVVVDAGSCAPPPPPPGPPVPPVVTPTPPPLPPGPVLTAGVPPRPAPAPTARVGDVPVAVVPTPAGTVRTQGTTTVSTATILQVGSVSLALDVTGAGEVRTTGGAAPQVNVVRDRVAQTSGGGMLPGTQVQAWLPLAGGNARPVTAIPVREDGTFTGELPFDGRTDRQTDGRPLPIGTHVLQLVGVDAAGQVTVIEQTVRIEQPAPSPEPDRRAGAPPTLRPGASIATNAGVPEAVRVVPVPEVRQARVEGSGWTMAVDVPSADGRVAPAEGGGALIELVEDDVAEVSGDGFLPGTRADVWLFSTPTLLGTVTIGPDGSFSGQVPVAGIATGEHTLQLQGVGSDGYVRAANLGVAVVPRAPEEPAAAPEPEVEAGPEPEPEQRQPDGSVEVITAAGQDATGTSPLVWIALLAALAGSGGWWFLIGRRRRDEDEEALTEGRAPR